MTDTPDPSSGPADMDDEMMDQLLRLAGPRPSMPEARLLRVHDGVHRHWKKTSRQRDVRRRVLAASAFAAAAATVVLLVWATAPERHAPPAPSIVAMVNQVEGRVDLAAGASISAGEWIETDLSARIGLRTVGGTSVRLDATTRARVLSERVIELARGALYIDSAPEASGLEVRTALATARDVGTQFEVRLSGEDLRLSVRSGIVELRSGSRTELADAGTELLVSTARADRRRIPTYGPQWEWTARVAPRLAISGRDVSDVLEDIARERGWRLRYADRDLADEAARFVLHGPIQGLGALEALDVVTATSQLSHRLDDGELVISRRTAVR